MSCLLLIGFFVYRKFDHHPQIFIKGCTDEERRRYIWKHILHDQKTTDTWALIPDIIKINDPEQETIEVTFKKGTTPKRLHEVADLIYPKCVQVIDFSP